MSCKTGLDVIASCEIGKNLADLNEILCNKGFQKYIKFLPTGEASDYMREMCTLTAMHVNSAFSAFQENFCTIASDSVKEIALKINSHHIGLVDTAVFVSAAVSIVFAILGNHADDRGNAPWIGDGCRTFSLISIIGGPLVLTRWLL